MYRILVQAGSAFALSVLLLTGCDRFGFAVKNAGDAPKEIVVVYYHGSECRTDRAFVLEPKKFYVSRCDLEDVERLVILEPRHKELRGAQLRTQTKTEGGIPTVELR